MNMRYGEIKILCWVVLSFFLFSCEKDEPDIVTTSRKTLFMYLPWSSNLTTNFYEYFGYGRVHQKAGIKR